MSLKCIIATAATYSPAVVLFVWAAVIADNRHLARGTLVFFLCLLGFTMAVAETVRICKRKKIRREARERRTLH